ncbi:unnamed protein product [Thelazia callipaeda]|uniref:C2H2-type domain-containing protein n=1 Tax=Thelazia callipaeda TaxID=103827 RepID=A0A158RBD9_THECL|nr:unnamed protein product [Thelazia callipaeda]
MTTQIDGKGDALQNRNVNKHSESSRKASNKELTNGGGRKSRNHYTSKESTREETTVTDKRDKVGRVSLEAITDETRRETMGNHMVVASGIKIHILAVTETRNAQRSTNSMTSEGFVYDGEMDLEEPFSDSDDNDAVKGLKKLSLQIPRGRIRSLSGTVPAVGYSPKWGGPTMCLSCLQFFDFPEHHDVFSEHLLNEHHIVIVEMNLIVDLKRYVEYWRQRFAKQTIDTIFPTKIPDENSEYYGKIDYFYEMSEIVPEDYALRQKLAMRRLEEALACQQREREDTNFVQQCIFCRYTARGNRSKIVHHLYMIHHLNLGSPDNLVFVTEYIEYLKSRLLSNECIYCEKRFPDRNTLMDHIRKRNHKEVNPKNSYYDKFYIINYLELGKRWLEVLKEDFEDTMPTFIDSDEEEEEDSWQEWQEDNIDMEQIRVICLFCEQTEDHVAPLLEHMKASIYFHHCIILDVHHFDLLSIIERENLDIYDRMKMVNYIRKENYNARCFMCGKNDFGSLLKLRQHYMENNHLSEGLPEKSVWCTEENLIPIFGNDHLAWMLESYIDEISSKADEMPPANGGVIEYLLQQSVKNTVKGVSVLLIC